MGNCGISTAITLSPRIPLNEYFSATLEHLADADDSEQLLKLWDAALNRLVEIRSKSNQFELIREASTMLSHEGAPRFAEVLKTRRLEINEDYISGDWQKAWDWWAHHAFLNSISAREELGKLHIAASIRKNAFVTISLNWYVNEPFMHWQAPCLARRNLPSKHSRT